MNKENIDTITFIVTNRVTSGDNSELLNSIPGDVFKIFEQPPYNHKQGYYYGYLKHNRQYGYIPQNSVTKVVTPKISTDRILIVKNELESKIIDTLRYGINQLTIYAENSIMEKYYSVKSLVLEVATLYSNFKGTNYQYKELKNVAYNIISSINRLRKIIDKDIKLFKVGYHCKPNYINTMDIFHTYRIVRGMHHHIPYLKIENVKKDQSDEMVNESSTEFMNLCVTIKLQMDQSINWRHNEIRFSLYDITTNEYPYITDVWCVKPEIKDEITSTSTKEISNVEFKPMMAIFKDLKMSDFYKNFMLIGKVYHNNANVDDKHKLPKGIHYMYEGALSVDGSQLKLNANNSHTMGFYLITDRLSNDVLPHLRKNSGKIASFNICVDLMAIKGTKDEIIQNQGVDFMDNISWIRSRNISYISIEDKNDRCDIYITLMELFLERKLKANKYNLKVTLDLIYKDGSSPESNMIYYGDNVPACYSVTSTIARHTNNPSYNDEFRVSLNKHYYKGLFLRLVVYNLITTQNGNIKWEADAFSLITLSNLCGCMQDSGYYKLNLYDGGIMNSITPDIYTHLSFICDDNTDVKMLPTQPLQMSYVTLKLQLVSTKMTSNNNIILLRNYTNNPNIDYNQVLDKLLQLNNLDKLKYMNETIFYVIAITEICPTNFITALHVILETLAIISAPKYSQYMKLFKQECQNISAPKFINNTYDALEKILNDSKLVEIYLNIVKLFVKCMHLLVYLMNNLQNNCDTETIGKSRVCLVMLRLFNNIKVCPYFKNKALLTCKMILLKKFTLTFKDNPNIFSLEDIFDMTDCLVEVVMNDDDSTAHESSPLEPFIQPFFLDYMSFLFSNFKDSMSNIMLFVLKCISNCKNLQRFKNLHIVVMSTYIKLCEASHIVNINDDINSTIRKIMMKNILSMMSDSNNQISWELYDDQEYILDVYISLLRYLSEQEFVDVFQTYFHDKLRSTVETYLEFCQKILMSTFFVEKNFKLYAITVVSLLKCVPCFFTFQLLSSFDMLNISYSINELLLTFLNSDHLRFEKLSPYNRLKFFDCVYDIRPQLIECIINHWKIHINIQDNFIITLFDYSISEAIRQIGARRFTNENNNIDHILSIFLLDMYEFCGQHNFPSYEYMKNHFIDTITSNCRQKTATLQYLDQLKILIDNKIVNEQKNKSNIFYDLQFFLIQLKNIIIACDLENKSRLKRDQELYTLKKSDEITGDQILYSYVMNKMAEYQLSQNNMIEAAYCYLDLANTLKWNDNTLSSNKCFPIAEQEKERKFKLMNKALNIFINEKYYEQAMEIYKILHPIIEDMFYDYKMASEYYFLHAECIQKAIKDIRAYPDYFVIQFKGPMFGDILTKNSFIYCGKNYAKLGEIINILQDEFPYASIMSTSDFENTNPTQHCIFLTGVTPISSSILANNDEICDSIQTYYQHNNVIQFQRTKPIGELKESVTNWAERTTYSVEFAVPGILCVSPIINITTQKLSPIENAIDDIESKNGILLGIIIKAEKDNVDSPSKLSSCLNGIIDSAVNGGVAKYCKEFLDTHTQTDDILIGKFKDTLKEQLRLTFKCLSLHQYCITPDLFDLHNKMVHMSKEMRSLIESSTGIDMSSVVIDLHELSEATPLNPKGIIDKTAHKSNLDLFKFHQPRKSSNEKNEVSTSTDQASDIISITSAWLKRKGRSSLRQSKGSFSFSK